MTNPVIGSTCSFSNTKPSRSYQRQAFSFSRTQRSEISSGSCCRVKASNCRPRPGALIFRRDEQLVEIALGQMQRQHRREHAAVVGDEKAPAFFDLHRNPRAQLRQQKIAGVLEIPVEAQLFIQTRAISSYSSGRAGRMVGGGVARFFFHR